MGDGRAIGGLSDMESRQIWEYASARFAEAAPGQVAAILGDFSANPESIWLAVEQPILQSRGIIINQTNVSDIIEATILESVNFHWPLANTDQIKQGSKMEAKIATPEGDGAVVPPYAEVLCGASIPLRKVVYKEGDHELTLGAEPGYWKDLGKSGDYVAVPTRLRWNAPYENEEISSTKRNQILLNIPLIYMKMNLVGIVHEMTEEEEERMAAFPANAAAKVAELLRQGKIPTPTPEDIKWQKQQEESG